MNRLLLFFLCMSAFYIRERPAMTQAQAKTPTVRELLNANGIADLRQYPDYFLNAKVEAETPSQGYIHVSYHINPSAEGLFIVSRALKVVGELGGWELATLPNETVIYHRNQVHFAPTHSLEISAFNPETRKDNLIYPPKPYQPVRVAFMERVAKAYTERGEAWFREHNHHMDPEFFDSALAGDVTVDTPSNSLVFNVRYGDPENANDPVSFTQQVLVKCTPIQPVEKIACTERAP